MITLNGAGLFGTSMLGQGTLRLNKTAATGPDTATSASAAEQVRAAGASLVAALRDLTASTKPVFGARIFHPVPHAASVTGNVARSWTVHGTSSVLQTTRAMNTQTDTTRVSSSSIGLDLSAPAVSVLQSAPLNLDVTSPEASSRLDSSSSVGLDLSPARASSLTSSTAIGLDTTSPDAPSTLASSSALGLDVTTPETASVLSSSSTLGLDVTSPQRASTIQSTAEMNTAPTTFAAYDVAMSGGTSHAQLSGSYTGTSTSLTVRTNLGSSTNISASASSVSVDLLNDANQVIGSFSGSITAGQVVSLGATGVKLRFTAGSLSLLGSSGKTNVSQTATTVSAAAAFNAGWGTAPVFENFQQVVAGSFTVNGVSIAVNANDSINSVISRINASAAGVTASVSGDKITLTSNANSEDAITLANDTSGFLAATKLSAATTTLGNVRDDLQVLSKTTQFASVTNGSFTVNGATISVNKATDSLSSLISSINASAAGVTASYDSVLDKLVLTTNANSEDQIAVSGDTSGFLSAAHLATGNTVRGNIRDDEQVLSKTTQFGTVATGSFTINGFAISVNKDTDSVTSIVSRINGAGAGVTAAYNSATDKIVLTGTTNSEDLITIGGDTSGFATAAHLSTGNTARGHLPEDGVVFSDLAPFAAVQNGSFVVDGKTIAVTTSDTVESIVGKINASGARVTAQYDSATDRVVLDATYDSEDQLPIGGDTSGFLAAAHLSAANTALGNIPDDLQVLDRTTQFAGVSSGSFTINGVSIAVDNSTDTVQTLLAKINASGAGVTASFDAGTNKISLVTNAASEDTIAVGNDTTGFLSATHLDSTNTVLGNIRDDDQVLSKTSQFAGVQSGSFTVRGTTIAIDVATDSLNDVIDRINNASAGVVAAYDSLNDRLTLTRTVADEDAIDVSSDTTGFLAATGLDSSNTQLGNLPDDTQVLSKTSQFASVSSGTINVNGHDIAIDAATDSLDDVLARINAASADVTATYSAQTDRVTISPSDITDTLFLEDGGTGFLGAIHVATGATGTHVNVNAAFNGTDANDPLFDPGMAVHAGSFVLNGTTISVAADDSVSSVIARINASAANVSAAFDSTTQTVHLTTKAATSDPISFAGDTSGFLAAAKIDGTATSTPGVADASAFAASLSRMPEYAGVVAGAVTINDQTIAIDPATTSVRSLAAALDALSGVHATLDEPSGELILAGDENATAMNISDTSGVLARLGIACGVFSPVGAGNHRLSVSSGTERTTNAAAIAVRVASAADELNAALALYSIRGGAGSSARDLRGITGSLRSLGLGGLTVTGDATTSPRLVVDLSALTTSLDGNAEAIASLLPGGIGRMLDSAVKRFADDSGAVAIAPNNDQTTQLADALKASALLSQL